MTALRNSLTDAELEEQAERGEPEKGRWSQQEQLTALLVDAVRRVEYVLRVVHHGDGPRPAAPDPVRRPGVGARRRTSKLSDASAEHLFQLINGGAA